MGPLSPPGGGSCRSRRPEPARASISSPRTSRRSRRRCQTSRPVGRHCRRPRSASRAPRFGSCWPARRPTGPRPGRREVWLEPAVEQFSPQVLAELGVGAVDHVGLTPFGLVGRRGDGRPAVAGDVDVDRRPRRRLRRLRGGLDGLLRLRGLVVLDGHVVRVARCRAGQRRSEHDRRPCHHHEHRELHVVLLQSGRPHHAIAVEGARPAAGNTSSFLGARATRRGARALGFEPQGSKHV